MVVFWAGAFSAIKHLLGSGLSAPQIAAGRYLLAAPGFAVALWMALHGRALAIKTLPGFPFPDEATFVDVLAERLVG